MNSIHASNISHMSISRKDLEIAFQSLYIRWQQIDEDTDWQNVKIVEQHGTTFLRIERRIPRTDEQKDFLDDVDKDDPESLLPSRAQDDPTVVYDIIYSPSYQVPVLYISFKNLARPSPDAVYELLVPAAHREQMQSVGVMGALSLTEHPVTGLPVYFVHPCRTQEVMQETSWERKRPEEYLMLWIGAIGASVGLNVSLELAR